MQIYLASLCDWTVEQFFRWFEKQCVLQVSPINTQL